MLREVVRRFRGDEDMIPNTLQAVVILLLAIAPGYLAIATWARAKTWKGFGGDLDTILRSLVVSLVVQIPMFPTAIWAGLYPDVGHVNTHAGALFLWLLGTVLIIPIGGGLLLSYGYDRWVFPTAR